MPATVWTFDTQIPADARWPVAVIERVLGAFAPTGGTVVFIDWPDAEWSDSESRTDRDARPDASDEVVQRRGTELGTQQSAGMRIVSGTETTVGSTRGQSRPNSGIEPDGQWRRDDVVADDDGIRGRSGIAEAVAVAHAAGYPARAVPAVSPPRDRGAVQGLSEYARDGSADLVITSTAPGAVDDRRADSAALVAARVLRAGGILVVLTHSDWAGGVLRDPIGTVITAGQSADLLYLQHVVAVHQPLAGGIGQAAAPRSSDVSAGHRRVHSDVLVLVQPHDHALDVPNAAAA